MKVIFLKYYEVLTELCLYLSQKVQTLFEDLIDCIKLLPTFPTRLEFRLVKMKREFGF